jgi:DNA-directed RNA polymerase sigma subunit (sigma70/sigma32)
LTEDEFRRYLAAAARAPLLTREEELELARSARGGDDGARKQLIEANLRLVISIARRSQGEGSSLTALINAGNVGLIQALEKFDPDADNKFSTYATWFIRRAIEGM